MKLITRDTDYAIRALCFIAKQNKRIISVSELAQALKIPRPFLRKLLQILHKKRLLNSYKGKGGGFELVQMPKKISLIDLIKVFQGSLKVSECRFKKAPCPSINNCSLKKKIDKIQKYIARELQNVTLAYLIKRKGIK